ncbi:type II secretion system protein [Escherichia coli]|nr:type II secretion system protein [Escherichia coli]HBN6443707.1 type II secretion system protein [Escherichia coli]
MIKKKGFTLLEVTIVLGIWNAYRFYEVSGYEKRSGSGIG